MCISGALGIGIIKRDGVISPNTVPVSSEIIYLECFKADSRAIKTFISWNYENSHV